MGPRPVVYASGPGYYDRGPGYYDRGDGYDHHREYNRDRYSQNDVTVNRTNVNERDVNINRTNVNSSNVNRAGVKHGRGPAAPSKKGVRKGDGKPNEARQ